MGPRGRETFVSPTDETVPLGDEAALRPPRFDEKSVQRAQPAVPLERSGRVRSWPVAVIALCVLGGLAGGLLGGLALTLFQRGEQRAEPQARESQPAPAAPDSQGAAAAPAPAVGASADANRPAAQEPAHADGAGPQTPADGAAASAPAQQQQQAEPAEADAEADASTQGQLRSALGEWLAATNSRDVGRQMNFYAPTVEAFYLSRNASREAVRAEKARLFAQASSVNVEAAAPEIRVSRDGRTAVMRFRKRYRIAGSDGSRNGEVLQELRWRRTAGGWKIVGERDLRVLQ